MTGFILPTYTGSASGWTLRDYRPDLVLTSGPAAGGTMQALGPVIDPATMWVIQRATCSTTSTATTSLRLYDSAVGPGNYLGGSLAGNTDEADYPQGLMLGASRQLLAVWSGGATDQSVGTLRLQIAILAES